MIGFVSSVAQGMVSGSLTPSGGTQTGQGSSLYVDAGALQTDGEPVKTASFHFTPTCGDDVMNRSMTLPNVPEPSVIALMAMGVVGVPLRRRMK